ncbi:MAG: hypothetical protein H0V66_00545 [Bdellovibrionales bacterium]|nr:hypothetical protein [Bdellovibrionales bacterium]
MKYVILASVFSLLSINAFSMGQKSSKDCCPSGNCANKSPCIGTGYNRNNMRRDVTPSKKNMPKASPAANGTGA